MSAPRSQFALLAEKRFGPFFVTQFLGAFNDNIFRNALIIFLAFDVARDGSSTGAVLINLAAGLFVLPFFLFSATFGQLADKYDKSRLIVLAKSCEVAIMLGAGVAFMFQSVPALIALLFFMGTQSALFGPVKYSILPQHLHPEELVGGNGLVGSGTFLAILLGTLAGGLLIALPNGGAWIAGALLVTAIAGLIMSLQVPSAPAAEPGLTVRYNPATETWRIFSFLRENRVVFLSILGISWFWLLGTLYLSQLPLFTRDLGGNEQVVTLLLVLFSVGIGTGSLLCERLSGHRVELGLVPLGSIGLTVFGIDLYFAGQHLGGDPAGLTTFLAQAGSWRVVFDVVLIGVFGGFYIVPLYSLIQERSKANRRSRVIAGNNILNAAFMVAGSLFAIAMLSLELTIGQLFLTLALMNAAVAIYIYTLVPEFLMRFITWVVIHLLYRIDARDLDRIPKEGPALLVCNHVSFVDAMIIGGSVRRPVRFVMYYKIFNIPIMNFVFRTAKAIPIAGAKEDPELLEKAYDRIAAALEDGNLVCIFPEGAITRTGEIDTFRPGVEKILERTPVPVVPLALKGLWGSFFSRRYGAAMMGIPRKLWSKIGLAAGAIVPAAEATAAGLQDQVQALRGDVQ